MGAVDKPLRAFATHRPCHKAHPTRKTQGVSLPATSSADVLNRAFEQVDADFEAHVATIRDFLRLPTVSADSSDMQAGAEATAALIEGAGGVAEIVETPGHPCVLGRIDAPGPRLLRYGMYDVQPADEDGWSSAPFGAELVDVQGVGECIVARGAANSKACLAAFLLALTSAFKVGDLTTGVTLLVDGEEELGSPHLPSIVTKRKSELQADAAFDMDLTADRAGAGDVHLGCKGIVSFRLTCSGGPWGGPVGTALHSSGGAVVASPAWALVRALSALADSEEPALDEGLEAAVIPREDRALIDALIPHFDIEDYLAEAGALAYKVPRDAKSILTALMYARVLNLNGIRTGHAEGKTIVPHEAVAALDLRIPYGADVDSVIAAVKHTVARAAPEVLVEACGVCPPARTLHSSPVARAMIESQADVGPAARVWPSAPWWAPFYLFEQVLEVPFVHGGAGHSCGAHAAIEYASLEGLRLHMRHSLTFLHRFAQESSGERG